MNDTLGRFRAHRLVAAFKARREPCLECEEDAVTAAVNDVEIHGLAVPYDQPTGDGRMIASGSLVWDLEEEGVPIIWDRAEGDHTGAVVGRIDALRADDSGVWVESARLFGTSDAESGAAVDRIVELIRENAVGWSVMLDDETTVSTFREAKMTENEDGSVTVTSSRSDMLHTITSGRLRHLAIVDTPAFPGARPVLGPAPVNAAVAAVSTYPAAHFEKWDSEKLVPLQVSPDGRVWGHAAGDGCYRGDSKVCRKYTPDPDAKMRNFHTGTVGLDNGSVIRVGALTAASLHADARGSLHEQRRHHEDSSTVWAKVIAWNDHKGRLCVSGSVVPGLSAEFLDQVAGLPLSVELWPVPGVPGLTLVGAHTVITPAWPVAASASSGDGVTLTPSRP